ncbi:glycosyltransferase, partial [Citrobacter sp. Igbk 16]|uniref:glycosyltransferase n=1 Tax=Citrobacter sp. Igbk 16 TaxID=2963958 RepID=UPI0023044C1D
MYSHFRGRFIQVIESLDIYDACSNHVVNIDKYVKDVYGLKTEIYAKHYHHNRGDIVTNIEHLNSHDEDIIFLHFSAYSEVCVDKVLASKGMKILHYHNITPHTFFSENSFLYNLCKKGREQLLEIKDKFNFITGDSLYNLDEIIKLGFPEDKTAKLPIIINENVVFRIGNIESRNLLFVGRICENKAQHKLIYFYGSLLAKKYELGCLYLVGKYDVGSDYYNKIKKIIEKLQLSERVILTGAVTEEELSSYYSDSSCFISFSEHEGFGVPLLEAAQYQLPVLALNHAATAETLNNSEGVCNTTLELEDKLFKVFTDSSFYERMIDSQNTALQEYSVDAWGKYADNLFEKILVPQNYYTTVSLVVCTYNRAEYLERCLDYLSKNYSDSFEVIVVNGPSTDNTNEV